MTTSNEHPIDSFNNLNTEGRFKILWDKQFTLKAGQNAHVVDDGADSSQTVVMFDGAQVSSINILNLIYLWCTETLMKGI